MTTITSDKKTPDGRSMVAIPFSIEFVAYVEEHMFFEHMCAINGNLDVIKNLHGQSLVDVLKIDDRLTKAQEGWNTILVERVK